MADHEHDRQCPDEPDASSDLMRQPDSPGSAPPTQRADHSHPKRETAWPTVVAIISFVWGGLSLLFSGCAALATPFYGALATIFEDAGLEEEAAEMRQMADLWWLWVIQGIIGTILAILLIVAGVGLIKRLYRGVRYARIWSVLVILQLLIFTPLSFYVSEIYGRDVAKQMQEIEFIFSVIGVVFMTVISLILPIFMLIWFARERIKEETQQWPP